MNEKIKEEDIRKSLKLFNIGKKISINELKKKYRKLVFKYHPDIHGDNKKNQEKMVQLNKSYKILIELMENYEMPMDCKELSKQGSDPMARFYNDWMWGNGA